MLRIMRRELRLLISERPTVLLVLLGAASAYALLIGNLYAGQIVQEIPVAVCDLDDSALSRELTRAVSETDQFAFAGNLSSEVEAVEVLRRGTASAVLVIPENFARNFYSQRATELAFLQDGANIVPVNYSTTPINLVVGSFSAQFNQLAAIANSTPTLSPAPVSMSLRMSGNFVQGYLEFYIYGVMLMAAHVGITLAFGISVLAEKSASARTILAKEILYLALSLISVMVGMVLLAAVFEMPFRGEMWRMLLICAIFLFTAENLAGLLGLFFKTELALVRVVVFYTLPALLTAGYIWPYEGMTPPVKFLSAIQPVHYALADFRRIALTGVDVTFWRHAGILLAVGLIMMILLISFGNSMFSEKSRQDFENLH